MTNRHNYTLKPCMPVIVDNTIGPREAVIDYESYFSRSESVGTGGQHGTIRPEGPKSTKCRNSAL